jgi:hypothetical protein
MLSLFSMPRVSLAIAAKEHYIGHAFHPHFDIFLDEVIGERGAGAGQQAVFQLLDRYRYVSTSSRLFLTERGNPEIYQLCDALNACFNRICREAGEPEVREKIKTFRRGAQDNQRSLMQFASHLIDRAPGVCIAHLTTHWKNDDDNYSYFRDVRPVSHTEVSEFRQKFTLYLTKKFPREFYLGYSFLLKHDLQSGYYLEAFVFLSSNALKPMESLLEELIARWNGDIAYMRRECVGSLLNQSGQTAHLSMLRAATLVTEPDHYFRVATPGNARRFWLSQSPIGKLTARTHSRKRSAATANERKGGREERLTREQDLNEEARRWATWEVKREAISEKRSAIRKKGARTRSKYINGAPFDGNLADTPDGTEMPPECQANSWRNTIVSPVGSIATRAMDLRHTPELKPRPQARFSLNSLGGNVDSPNSPMQPHASESPETSLTMTGAPPSPEAETPSPSPTISPEATGPTYADPRSPSPVAAELEHNDNRKKFEIRKKRVIIVPKP